MGKSGTVTMDRGDAHPNNVNNNTNTQQQNNDTQQQNNDMQQQNNDTQQQNNDTQQKHNDTQQKNNDTQQKNNAIQNDVEEIAASSSSFDHIAPTSPGPHSHLAAATSSPSLLAGCADSNTHAGAIIERHVQAHSVSVSLQTPLSPIPVSPATAGDAFFPLPLTTRSPSDGIPQIPDSVFLTPSPPRPRGIVPDRPNSAPAHYLERLSGQILRLVGNHYLCSTCGRQLRTIGDQLTMETSLNHISRALSANNLDSQQGN